MHKEIPILFSTPMVKAILGRRKIMTRRLKGLEFINESFSQWEYLGVHEHGHLMRNEHGATNAIKCLYGKPGDLLWVRETLYQEGELGLYYVADNEQIDEDTIPFDYRPYRNYACCKVPAIHMQKSVARIWLEITDVRLERLQDITGEDARAEGIQFYQEEGCRPRYKDYLADASGYGHQDHDYPTVGVPVTSFATLWKKINGEESWTANPWVWVVSFKVLSTTGKPVNKIEVETIGQ